MQFRSMLGPPHGALRAARAWLPAALLLLAPAAAGAAETPDPGAPLRFCADPANLPFSSRDAHAPGLYLEIGQAIARAMDRDAATVWNLTYFGKRALRTTLLAGQCDAAVGLPDDRDFMGSRVIFSRPVLRLGYALVTPQGMRVAGLSDLAGKRVAVQFASPPQSLLAMRDDVSGVTFTEPEAAMRALAAGEVDAAFIWGPVAGYLNRTALHGAYQVTPVEGRGMQWDAAIGFDRANAALRDAFDAALAREAGTIAALAVKYGLPDGPPLRLAENAGAGARIRLAQASSATATDAAPAPAGASAGASGVADKAAPGDETKVAMAGAGTGGAQAIAEGREVFNGTCAHCHGPDAVQAERRINLRLLQRRYGDDMEDVYFTTVTEGRPSKGMPTWKEVFSHEQFEQILAFLKSVQTP